MRWPAVDLTRKLVCFKPMKTPEKQVVILLHPALEEHLLSIADSDNAEAHLFPSLAGKKTGGAHGLSMRFSEIVEKAGIKAGVARPQSVGGRAINPNALRLSPSRPSTVGMGWGGGGELASALFC
ncbi:MAG: integrase family protein [Limisphaerales bacterium]|nr:MAG: integrase family protein [Limisphaerales bacterium]KAG0507326.1 MAG: integrase family protein [Limisphaerales bacterium]TXT47853.1 MAG: integrase family protein [Limisphaerales bacterium]